MPLLPSSLPLGVAVVECIPPELPWFWRLVTLHALGSPLPLAGLLVLHLQHFSSRATTSLLRRWRPQQLRSQLKRCRPPPKPARVSLWEEHIWRGAGCTAC